MQKDGVESDERERREIAVILLYIPIYSSDIYPKKIHCNI